MEEKNIFTSSGSETDELKKLLDAAEAAAYEEMDISKAMEYYAFIKEKYPKNWKAQLYSVVCSANLVTFLASTDVKYVDKIVLACKDVIHEIPNILNLLIYTVPQNEWADDDVSGDFFSKITSYADVAFKTSKKIYISQGLHPNTEDTRAYLLNVEALSGLLLIFGDLYETIASADKRFLNLAVRLWEDGVKYDREKFLAKNWNTNIPDSDFLKRHINKIQKYKPNYRLPEPNFSSPSANFSSEGRYKATSDISSQLKNEKPIEVKKKKDSAPSKQQELQEIKDGFWGCLVIGILGYWLTTWYATIWNVIGWILLIMAALISTFSVISDIKKYRRKK